MLEPISITVRGKHDVGKTTTASLLKMFLEENGYTLEILDSDMEAQRSIQEREIKDRAVTPGYGLQQAVDVGLLLMALDRERAKQK